MTKDQADIFEYAGEVAQLLTDAIVDDDDNRRLDVLLDQISTMPRSMSEAVILRLATMVGGYQRNGVDLRVALDAQD